MENSELYLFKINQINYCFNCMTYDFIEVPEYLYDICDLFIKYDRIISNNKKNIKEFLDFMHLNANFFKTKVCLYENKKPIPIFSFCPAHNCNFECKYCFAKNKSDYNEKEISIHTINSIFEFITNNFSDYDNFRLEFVSGGEPLLNLPAIKHACSISENLYRQRKINFKIILVSNGSLLTDETLKLLNNYNVFLGISFEGTEKNQNNLRLMKNKKNSYSTVVSNIKKITCSNNYNNLKNNIWTISVITNYCDSLIDIIENNIKLGVRSMELRIARGNENEDIYLNKNNIQHFRNLYFQLYEYFKEHIKHNKYDVLKVILNNYDSFGKLIKKIICNNYIMYRCSASVNKLAFAANGDIYPCDSFVGNKEFLMGNVLTKKHINNKVIFKNRCVNNRAPCKSCKFKYLCGGDCYYNAYINNNEISNCETSYCHLMQFLCELAMKLVLLLKKSNNYEEIRRYLLMRDIINKY